jgi:hypothetical protein
VEEITADVSPANWLLDPDTDMGKQFLYAQREAVGTITYHKTVEPPTYGRIPDRARVFYVALPNNQVPTEDYFGNMVWTKNLAASNTQTKFSPYSLYFDSTQACWLRFPMLRDLGPEGTIEMFVYYDSAGDTDNRFIFGSPNYACAFELAYFANYGTNTIKNIMTRFNTNSNAGTHQMYGGTWPTFDVQAWHHVALSWRNGIFKAFVDGWLCNYSNYIDHFDPEKGAQTRYDDYDPIYIGNRTDAAADTFKGYIDGIKITFGAVKYWRKFTPPASLSPDMDWFDTKNNVWKNGNPTDGWTEMTYPRVYMGETRPRGRTDITCNFETMEVNTYGSSNGGSYRDQGDESGHCWWTSTNGIIVSSGGPGSAKFGTYYLDVPSGTGTQRWLLTGNERNPGVYAALDSAVYDVPWEASGFVAYDSATPAQNSWWCFNNSSHFGVMAGLNGSQQPFLYVSSNGSTWNVANAVTGSAVTLSANTWYHWAVGWDGANYYVSFNGTRYVQVASTSPVCYNKYNMALGGHTGGGWDLPGYIDGFKLRSEMPRFAETRWTNEFNGATYTVPTTAPQEDKMAENLHVYRPGHHPYKELWLNFIGAIETDGVMRRDTAYGDNWLSQCAVAGTWNIYSVGAWAPILAKGLWVEATMARAGYNMMLLATSLKQICSDPDYCTALRVQESDYTDHQFMRLPLFFDDPPSWDPVERTSSYPAFDRGFAVAERSGSPVNSMNYHPHGPAIDWEAM